MMTPIPVNAIPVRGTSAMVPVRVLGSTHAGERMDELESDYEVEFPEGGVVARHPGCFALKVEGDCMNRRYPDGCMVLVDPSIEPRNGHAVVAEFEDGRSLLRIYKSQTPGGVWEISLGRPNRSRPKLHKLIPWPGGFAIAA